MKTRSAPPAQAPKLPCRHGAAIASALALALLAPGRAAAIDYTWNANNSFWDIATSWAPVGVPTAADNVFVRPVSGPSTILTIDNTTGTARANQLTMGSATAQTVTLRQTGGTLETVLSAIGSGGAAIYNHIAGTHRATDILIGRNTGDSATYTFDAGTIQATNYLSVGGYGGAGIGSFVQNGGAASAGILELGWGAGSTGTITRNNGTLTAGSMVMATSGTATINNFGGDLTVTGNAGIGTNPGATGTLRLAGGATTLGSVNQGGASPTGISRLILDGGSLAVTSGFVRASEMVLGDSLGRDGTYSTGTSANVQLGSLTVGRAGTGTFVQDGGTVAVAGAINVGVTGSGAGGTYRMNGGTLTAGSMALGGAGGASGTFEDNGGTATINGPVTLGAAGSNGVGRILVTGGGWTTINGGLTAASSGPGHEISVVGVPGVAQSTLLAFGGATLTPATRVVALPAGSVNFFGPTVGGIFVSDGGGINFASAPHTIESLRVAETNNSVVYLQNSTLSVSGDTVIAAGPVSSGQVSIGSGSIFRPTNLTFGTGTGSTGFLSLDGGSLELPFNSFFGRSNPGIGILSLNSGTLTFNRSGPGNGFTYVQATELNIGQSSIGSFELRVVGGVPVGSVQAANSVSFVSVDGLTVGSATSAGSSLVIDGTGGVNVAQSATVRHSLSVLRGYLSVNGRLDVWGRLVVEDRLTIGNVLDNRGQFFGSGYFFGFGSGRIANSGSFQQNSAPLLILVPGGIDNTGLWSTAAGHRLELSTGTGTFRNAGTLSLLAGSTIAGTGSLQNQALGTIQGAGRIETASFSNAGRMVAQSGRIEIVYSLSNTGTMVLADDLSSFAGGTITNTGRIEGRGVVYNTVQNNAGGTVEAKGGTLQIASAMANNAGTLAAQNGAMLVFAGPGLTQNTGTIRLNGGSFDNTPRNLDHRGQMLVSTGHSQFLGAMTAASGSKVIVSGLGALTFYDALDFQSGSELRISAGSVATFFGSVRQRTGALFTGTGQKFYEAGFTMGGSPGLALDGGDVSFGSGALVESEIGGLAAGTEFDQLRVAGSLSFGGTLKLVSWNGFVAQPGQRFDLFDWGSASGSFTVVDSSGFLVAPGAWLDTSRLYIDGSVAVVPEPGTWALFGAGLFGLAAVAGRHRRAATSAARRLATA